MGLILGLVVCLTAAIAVTLTAAGAGAREAGCFEPVDPAPPTAGATPGPSCSRVVVPLGGLDPDPTP